MRYYSLNNSSPLTSFKKAVQNGIAPDRGLYFPEEITPISEDFINNISDYSNEEIAYEVIKQFIGDEIPAPILKEIIKKTISFDFPVVNLDENIGSLELFHGPTLAFKDFALQFLSKVFNILLEREGKKITIIGATSGDTGSAAIEAFKNNSLANIIILHPEGKVSDFQRKQMTTVDAGNIYNIAIDGNFDDCQALVKKLLVDKDFNNKHNLASINSINWGRVLAQVVYYFYSAFKVMKGKDNKSVNFSVPTGNFGDAYAGYVAKKMGLPIEKIIIATNSNDILSNFFKNGIYKISKVIPTISPSMDIQLASNFERLLYETLDHDPSLVREYMKTLSNIGSFKISNEKLKTLNETFIGLGVSDEATIERIKSTYNNNSLVIDPHTSVGLEAAYNHNYSLKGPCIVLSTAHPVKFADAVSSAININSDLPEKYKNIFSLDEKYHSLKNNLDTIKNFIDSTSNV